MSRHRSTNGPESDRNTAGHNYEAKRATERVLQRLSQPNTTSDKPCFSKAGVLIAPSTQSHCHEIITILHRLGSVCPPASVSTADSSAET